jgi:anti-anti-sigma factor
MSSKKNNITVLDLSKVNYIDSNWIGVFIYLWKLYNEYNKTLLFLIPPGFVLDILKETHLDTTFEIIDSIEGLKEYIGRSNNKVNVRC